jgi:hypothetical protein
LNWVHERGLAASLDEMQVREVHGGPEHPAGLLISPWGEYPSAFRQANASLHPPRG